MKGTLKLLGFILLFFFFKEVTYLIIEVNLNNNASFLKALSAFHLQLLIFIYTIIVCVIFYMLEHLLNNLKPYLSYFFSFIIVSLSHVISMFAIGYFFLKNFIYLEINDFYKIFGVSFILFLLICLLFYKILNGMLLDKLRKL